MAAPTLDRVLTEAETLPSDDREILEELLRKRRIEEWRNDTAAEARKAGRAFRSGKLKAQSVEKASARLAEMARSIRTGPMEKPFSFDCNRPTRA